MDSLDLGTLSIKVKADGVNTAQSDLNNLNSTIKQTENTSSGFGGKFKSLGETFRSSIGDVKIFGTSLGEVGSAMSGGAGLAGLLGGAVGALSMQFIQLAMQAIQAAIQAISEFISKGVELASNLNEVANVVNVTFGDGAKEVDKWARTTAQSFGLTELQAKKYAGTLGAILKPTQLNSESIKNMSTNLAQLSGDLASFWNTSQEQAFNALRSAISGETEPMKQFGVVMTQANLEAYALSQGLDKSFQNMTQAEQATIRYNYILANTATAQGDFARTSEQYANVSRNLENAIDSASSKFGQGLIPSLTEAKQYFIDFINSNEETIQMLGRVIGVVINSLVRVTEVITIPFNAAMTLINKVFELIEPLLNKIMPAIEKIKEASSGILDALSLKVKKSNDDIKYSFESIKGTAEDAFSAIDKAYTSFKDKQMKKYEEYLRQQYKGDTLQSEKNYQERLAEYEKLLDKKLAKDAEYERKKAELEGSGGSSLTKHATGTIYSKGGLALVGENGAELVRLASGDKVYTHTQTKEILNNNGGNSDALLMTIISTINDVKSTISNMPYKQTQLNRLG